MRMTKRALTLMIVITLIVGITFSSTVIAETGNRQDPLSQILAVLLGIQPSVEGIEDKVDAIDTKIDAIDTKIDAFTPKQILEYREGFDTILYGSGGSRYVKNTQITADNPVLFTVYLFMSGKGYVDIRVKTFEMTGTGSTSVYSNVKHIELTGDEQTTTITFPGKEMNVNFYAYDTDVDHVSVAYNVMVEGNAGTIVTVHNPPT